MTRSNLIRGAVVVLIVVLVLGGRSYNRYVTSEETVRAAWSQVRNVEQRRMDLIPALVEVTEAYAAHERRTMDLLTRSRAAYLAVDDDLAGVPRLEEVDAAVVTVVALSARYPLLRASELYRSLEFELRGAENRIAIERLRYNDAAARHRTLVRKYPYALFTRSVTPVPLFTRLDAAVADDSAR